MSTTPTSRAVAAPAARTPVRPTTARARTVRAAGLSLRLLALTLAALGVHGAALAPEAHAQATSFLVTADPTDPIAGDASTITITALDNGSPIANFLVQQSITVSALTPGGGVGVLNANVSFIGSGIALINNGDGTATIPAGETFDNNGQAMIRATSNVAGEEVEIQVDDGTASGTTDPDNVVWQAGPLQNFLVVANPTSLAPPQATQITVTARDEFDNPIPNYTAANDISVVASSPDVAFVQSGAIAINDLGGGTATIPAGETFDANGQATFAAQNDLVDNMVTITVTETRLLAAGSATVTWEFPVVSFMVTAAPTSPSTGTASIITVTALDAGGNPIPGFMPLTDLLLEASTGGPVAGGGTLTPNVRYTDGVQLMIFADNLDGTAIIASRSLFDGNGQGDFMVTNAVAEGPVTIAVTQTVSGETGDTQASNTDVTWQVLDRFVVSAQPTMLAAGQTTILTVQALDSGGNPIPNFTAIGDITISAAIAGVPTMNPAYTPGTVPLTDNGDGTATILSGTSFGAGGAALILITNTVAEGPVRFTVSGNNRINDTGGTGTDVTWTPGALDHFDVTAGPTSLIVDNPTTITLTALDAFDNFIPNQMVAQILISQMGGVGITYDEGSLAAGGGTLTDNNDTSATLDNIQFDANGQISFMASTQNLDQTDSGAALNSDTVTFMADDGNGVTGSTADSGTNVTWMVDAFAQLSAFAANGVTTTVAGFALEVRLTAADQFGNLIDGFTPGSGISVMQAGAANGATIRYTNRLFAVTDNGDGTGLIPPPQPFVNGLGSIEITDTVAEGPITFTFTELDTPGATDSEMLTWVNGGLNNFLVAAAATQVGVGPPGTTITVTARDFFGNPIPNLVVTTLNIAQSGGTGTGFTYAGANLTDNLNGTATIDSATFDGNGQLTFTVQNTDLNQNDSGDALNFDVVRFTVTDPATNSTGNTGGTNTDVQFNVGALFDFVLTPTPATQTAGFPVTVTVATVDQFGNRIHNAPTGPGGISISTTVGTVARIRFEDRSLDLVDQGGGMAMITSNQVFVNGRGTIAITDDEAETATFNFTDPDSPADEDVMITWNVGALQNFLVTADRTSLTVSDVDAVTITLTARDFVNNEIPNQMVAQIDISQMGGVGGIGMTGFVYDPASLSVAGTLTDDMDGTATLTGVTFDPNGQLTFTVTNTKLNQNDSGDALNFDLVRFTADAGGGVTGDTGDSPLGDVQWNVGPLDHYTLTPTPQPQTAGLPVRVRIEALDLFDNHIHNQSTGATGIDVTTMAPVPGSISYQDRIFTVTDNLDGSASIDSNQLFTNGIGSIAITNTVTEMRTFTFADNDPAIPVVAMTTITWNAGGLDNFLVQTDPPNPIVGTPVTITVTARDASNNPLPGQMVDNLTVTQMGGVGIFYDDFMGDGGVLMDGGDGTSAIISGVVFDAMGRISFTAVTTMLNQADTGAALNTDTVIFTVDSDNPPATGNTDDFGENVTFMVGALDSFLITADTTTQTAGLPVTVTIAAIDLNMNRIHGVSTSPGIVVDQSGGSGKDIFYQDRSFTVTRQGNNGDADIDPGQIFINGLGSIAIIDNKAEGPVTFDFEQGVITGTINITWTAGGLASFLVQASPTDLIVGNATTITITALDGSGNPLPSLNLGGGNNLTIAQAGGAATGFTYGPVQAPGMGNLMDNGNGTATISNVVFDANGQISFTVTNTDLRQGDAGAALNFDTIRFSVMADTGQVGDTGGTMSDVTWRVGAVVAFRILPNPPTQTATMPTVAVIEAIDTFGNRVDGYTTTPSIAVDTPDGSKPFISYDNRTFSVIDNGDGTATIDSGQVFTNGRGSIEITNNRAESALFTFTQSVTAIVGSNTFTWEAGGLQNFQVVGAPSSLQVDQFATITLTARDAGGNILDFDANGMMNLTFLGSINISQSGGNPNGFTYDPVLVTGTGTLVDNGDGTARINSGAMADANGQIAFRVRVRQLVQTDLLDALNSDTVRFSVTESVSNAMGNSGGTSPLAPPDGFGDPLADVTWTIGAVTRYTATGAPIPQAAGMPILTEIQARDAFGNLFHNHQIVGATGITVSTSGTAAQTSYAAGSFTVIDNMNGTATIQSGQLFTNGRGNINITDTRAETATFTFDEVGSGIAPANVDLTWIAGAFTNFVVTVDVTNPIANEIVTFTVQAFDAFGNFIPNFDQTDVTGAVAPARVAIQQIGGSAVDVLRTFELGLGLRSPIFYDPAPATLAGNLVDDADGTARITNIAPGMTPFDAMGRVFVRVRNTKAEGPVSFNFRVFDANNTGFGSGTSPGVRWFPDGIDHFLLVAQQPDVSVGDQVVLALTARDQFNNPIPGYSNDSPIEIASTHMPPANDGVVRFTYPVGVALDRMDGTAQIASNAVFDATGRRFFQARDILAEDDVIITATQQVGLMQITGGTDQNDIGTPTNAPGFDGESNVSWDADPAQTIIVELPGQTAIPGVLTVGQALSGTPDTQFSGISYGVRVLAVDQFFNIDDDLNFSNFGNLASILISTTDPFDDETVFIGRLFGDGGINGVALFNINPFRAALDNVIQPLGSPLVADPNELTSAKFVVRPNPNQLQLKAVLPGQQLIPGQGVVNADGLGPRSQNQNAQFKVLLVAVDNQFNVREDVSGSIGLFNDDNLIDNTLPSLDAARFGTSYSGEDATTALVNGRLNVILNQNGLTTRVDTGIVDLGTQLTGSDIANQIQSQVSTADPSTVATNFTAAFLPEFRKYLLTSGNAAAVNEPSAVTVVNNLATSAAVLKLGAANGGIELQGDVTLQTQPMSAGVAVFAARNAVAGLHTLFARADVASVDSDDVLLQTFNGAVVSDQYVVNNAVFQVVSATVLGDGNGNISQVSITFNLEPAPAFVDLDNFTLDDGINTATGNRLVSLIGKTLVLELDVPIGGTSTKGLTFAFDSTGSAMRSTVQTGSVPLSDYTATGNQLIDGAPPVLISTTALDTDGNGGLDVLKLVFSEPIKFRAGSGTSISAPFSEFPKSAFDAGTDPIAFSQKVNNRFFIRLNGETGGADDFRVVRLADGISGANNVALDMQAKIRALASGIPDPQVAAAYANATVVFDIVSQRFVIKSGVPNGMGVISRVELMRYDRGRSVGGAVADPGSIEIRADNPGTGGFLNNQFLIALDGDATDRLVTLPPIPSGDPAVIASNVQFQVRGLAASVPAGLQASYAGFTASFDPESSKFILRSGSTTTRIGDPISPVKPPNPLTVTSLSAVVVTPTTIVGRSISGDLTGKVGTTDIVADVNDRFLIRVNNERGGIGGARLIRLAPRTITTAADLMAVAADITTKVQALQTQVALEFRPAYQGFAADYDTTNSGKLTLTSGAASTPTQLSVVEVLPYDVGTSVSGPFAGAPPALQLNVSNRLLITINGDPNGPHQVNLAANTGLAIVADLQAKIRNLPNDPNANVAAGYEAGYLNATVTFDASNGRLVIASGQPTDPTGGPGAALSSVNVFPFLGRSVSAPIADPSNVPITPTANRLQITLNNDPGGPYTITLPASTTAADAAANIQTAVRALIVGAQFQPAYSGFTAFFDTTVGSPTEGRIVLRSGAPNDIVAVTSAVVLPGNINDATSVLGLGVAAGGFEERGDATFLLNYQSPIENPGADATGDLLLGLRNFALSGAYEDRSTLLDLIIGGPLVAQGAAEDPGTDATETLRMGPDFLGMGAIQKDGQAAGLADLDDWTVLSADGRFNLLEGLDESAFAIDANVVTIFLNNIPNSGTGAPIFIYLDDGDGASIVEDYPGLGGVPNGPGRLVTNAPGLDPVTLINQSDPANGSSPFVRFVDNQDLNPFDRRLDVEPGLIMVDGSPSVPPLGADSGGVLYNWALLSAPPGVVAGDLAFVGSSTLTLTMQASVNGAYQLRLTITVLDQNLQPDANNQSTNESGQVFSDIFVNVRDVPTSPEALVPIFRGVTGQPIQLDATESIDANLQNVLYEWQVVSTPPGALAPSFDDTSIGAPTFTAQIGSGGCYVLQAFAFDGAPLAMGVTNDVVGTVTTLIDNTQQFRTAGVKVGEYVRFFPNGMGGPTVFSRITAVLQNRLDFAPLATPIAPNVPYSVSSGAPVRVNVVVDEPGNAVPSAHAGRDQRVPTGTVTLDGSGSRDPNADALTFQWSEVAGNPSVVFNQSVDTTLQVLPVPILTGGTYRFRLTVTDALGLASCPDEVIVVVSDNNPQNPRVPPTAVAQAVGLIEVDFDGNGSIGPRERFGRVGQAIVLSAVQSTDDQIVQSYRWEQVGGPSVFGPSASGRILSFVPLIADTYTFRLTVFDDRGLASPPVLLAIRVVGALDGGPPIAVVPASIVGNVGQAVGLDATGSGLGLAGGGIDPTQVSFLWYQLEGPGSPITNPMMTQASFTPNVPGIYVFAVRVTDPTSGVHHVATVEASIQGNANMRPIARIAPIEDFFLPEDGSAVTITLDGSASSDPDEDPLTYHWEQLTGANVSLDLTDPARPKINVSTPGGYRFRLTVTDDAGNASVPAEETFNANTRTGFVAATGTVVPGSSGGGCIAGEGNDPTRTWPLLALILTLVALRLRRREPTPRPAPVRRDRC